MTPFLSSSVTPSTERLEQLLRSGQLVTIADRAYLFCRADDEFQDGPRRFRALRTGVYHRTQSGPTSTWTWHSPLPDFLLTHTIAFAYTQPDPRFEMTLSPTC